jgi:hypothetical protein
MNVNRQNIKKKKQDITLLTLLAYEATGDSQKLLQKHGMPKANNVVDLENKLAELYFSSPDKKLDLEKELADIHPHKKWFIRVLGDQIKKEEPKKEEIKVVELKDEKKLNCDCSQCTGAKEITASAEGESQSQLQINNTNLTLAITALGIIGIVALAMTLNKKN